MPGSGRRAASVRSLTTWGGSEVGRLARPGAAATHDRQTRLVGVVLYATIVGAAWWLLPGDAAVRGPVRRLRDGAARRDAAGPGSASPASGCCSSWCPLLFFPVAAGRRVRPDNRWRGGRPRRILGGWRSPSSTRATTTRSRRYVDLANAVRKTDSPWVHPLTVHECEGHLRHGWDGEPPTAFLATADGETVGAGELHTSRYDNLHLAWLEIEVHPGPPSPRPRQRPVRLPGRPDACHGRGRRWVSTAGTARRRGASRRGTGSG